MNIQAIKTRIFRERENLFSFVIQHLPKLADRSVLVVTSKIVALGEGRTQENTEPLAKVRAIQAESDWAAKTKYVWLTLKDGMFMASAGIDESNADGKLILLPKDSFRAASRLRRQLMRHYRVRHLGVIIADSRTIPLRAGVIGMAIGYAGLRGLHNYHTQRDIFGRKFRFTRVDVADSLAAAAVLLMGEGNERQPLAVITEAPVEFAGQVRRRELVIHPSQDIYKPLLKALEK
jgi:coenzyme F420-0:L-glutamate ligase